MFSSDLQHSTLSPYKCRHSADPVLDIPLSVLQLLTLAYKPVSETMLPERRVHKPAQSLKRKGPNLQTEGPFPPHPNTFFTDAQDNPYIQSQSMELLLGRVWQGVEAERGRAREARQIQSQSFC